MISLLAACFASPITVAEVAGRDVGVRIVKVRDECFEEYFARLRDGSSRTIAVSAAHPAVARPSPMPRVTAIDTGGLGLFSTAPSFRFQEFQIDRNAVILRSNGDQTIEKRIEVPQEGKVVRVTVRVGFGKDGTLIRSLMDAYAFAPDGKPGKPETTFAPGLRPAPNQVIGDHFFRSPVVFAQQGRSAFSLIPNVDVLADNRPMPTVLDLNVLGEVIAAPMLAFGFADHRLVGHVAFANDAAMLRKMPQTTEISADLIVDGDAEPLAGLGEPARYLWERDGRRYFDRIKPQAMPFQEYARVCYPAAFTEAYGDNKLGWLEVEIDGKTCGGIPAGWGFDRGWVSWQCWFNNLRSAWGMKWWGTNRPGVKDWADKADKMLNLALAAPMDRGACPTTYQSREKTWKGCLIAPDPSCYYDLTNMAWKGIWLLRWYVDFPDCPRKDDILSQCRQMADCMVRNQNADGSIPTWLTKDHRVVPILDHSAQTALPAWFLLEFARVDGNGKPYAEAATKAADFLLANVVDQRTYYDFETFFSCSPKTCLQRGTVLDDVKMHDPYTMEPPQNTLAMQWVAEALRAVGGWTRDERYAVGALKAIDRLCLYQNTWPISYRPVAYTYGGFGVQNSDGEYHDARQAQFGTTLCDLGAQLGRRDLFERGVAAVRASLALINHPLHDQNGIYPNPNYPPGLMPENCGHGGTDQQNGRTGFDWGEGSGLTSMAWLLKHYGGVFHHVTGGWAVGIDGVAVKPGAIPEYDAASWSRALFAPMNAFAAPWTGIQMVEVVRSDGKRGLMAKAQAPLQIRRIEGRVREGKPVVVAIPGWSSPSGNPRIEARFVDARGGNHPAAVGLEGLEASIPAEILDAGLIRLDGKFDGQAIECAPFRVFLDPTFRFDDWRMPGWVISGSFPDLPTRSKRMAFNAGDTPFIGTCEDGRGGYDDSYTGTVESPAFTVSRPKIRLLVGGGSGDGVYVELIRLDTGAQVAVERGRNREAMDERVWDVSALGGIPLRIRIVDRETGGWGHINVGLIRTVDR